MLATKLKQQQRCLLQNSMRLFSVDHGELKALEQKVKRKLHVMKMFTEYKDFDYEPPQMFYDKQSGEIKIKEKHVQETKKIINNMDDLEREKQALLAEVGLNQEGKPIKEDEPIDVIAEKIKTVNDRMAKEFDIDPSTFYVFSRDFMRVDLGLIIQRPAIFMHFSKRDAEFLKYKSNVMNEYYSNQKQFTDEFEEISRLNEDVIGGNNPYTSKMNIDNYPTHKMVD